LLLLFLILLLQFFLLESFAFLPPFRQGRPDNQQQERQGQRRFEKNYPHVRSTGRERPRILLFIEERSLPEATMIPLPLRATLAALLCASSLPLAALASDGECPPPPQCPVCPVCPVCPQAVPDEPPPPPAKPLQPAAWSDIAGWNEDRHAQAWPALLQSCGALATRIEWEGLCRAADRLGDEPSDTEARRFFETWFVPWSAVNPDESRSGMVTGYYEPVIRGSREPSANHRWPVHAPPQDMLVVDLADSQPDVRHMRLRGRLEGNRVVPYWTRGDIARMGEDFPARVLYWAADAVDLFFLHVQGSGQIQLADGERVRIGYADQNGHPYVSIGRWLVDQGEMSLDQVSMQGIQEWARRNPKRMREMLDINPSYVFFRELPVTGDGPIGALGVPLTPGRSMAIDPRFIPLGVPVFLSTTRPLSDKPLRRLMLGQDTGSAIRGVVRADFYWGTGAEAGELAGRMKQQGQMWVLLPRGMTP
jgi:membrane-bound lytic murein transglycosylase A